MKPSQQLKCLRSVVASHFELDESQMFRKTRRRKGHETMAVLIFSYYAWEILGIPGVLIAEFSNKSYNAVWKNRNRVSDYLTCSIPDKEYLHSMTSIKIAFESMSKWEKLRIYFLK